MVDPIGPRPVKPNDRIVVPVARAAAPTEATGEQARAVSTGSAQTLSRQMAAQPPIDAERVAKIKRAIAQGRFPIEPSSIADRMIALKHRWVPND